ncbi:Bordetella uptake gene [Moorella glycerini]|uniref:Tripartite tricarboxylate transporter family receptor n=1 Tax=Neomoorella stamsii TaxID=1266720 RepID=A0A9X7P7Q9_9FIRM|nr:MULTISPECIES: tripartite tricarboxylate transporter substrate binding protein [Moorella]PRR77502.1 Tripartite tricarboxylate transporter family receptor [Moorella stamsii]CEP68251.1 Bordetella uptake gene [Moorella glycerini]
MMLKRFAIVLASVALLGVGLVLGGCAKSEKSFPKGDITIVVPFGAGGGTDQVARVLGDLVDKAIEPAVVIVNKTGGAGAVGLTEVSKAQPDGYTLVLMTSNISTLKWTGHSKLTYKDFEPICAVNYDAPALIVRSDSPWKSYEDFAKTAKERTVRVATGAPGGLWQAGALVLAKRAGLQLNIVPAEQGGAPAAVKLLGGHVEAIVVPPNEAASQIESKQFRVLGVMAPDRNPFAPDAPTFKELGLDLDIRSVRGFLAPKGTPAEVIKTLEELFKTAWNSKEYQDYMKKTGSNTIWMGTQEYISHLTSEYEKYHALLKETGLAKE